MAREEDQVGSVVQAASCCENVGGLIGREVGGAGGGGLEERIQWFLDRAAELAAPVAASTKCSFCLLWFGPAI